MKCEQGFQESYRWLLIYLNQIIRKRERSSAALWLPVLSAYLGRKKQDQTKAADPVCVGSRQVLSLNRYTDDDVIRIQGVMILSPILRA